MPDCESTRINSKTVKNMNQSEDNGHLCNDGGGIPLARVVGCGSHLCKDGGIRLQVRGGEPWRTPSLHGWEESIAEQR